MNYDNVRLTYADDDVRTYIDEYGASRPGDSEELTRQTDNLLNELRGEFGDPEVSYGRTRVDGGGSTYGGLDVVAHSVEYVWPAVATALAVSTVRIIRAIVDLKKSRKITIEFTKDGSCIQRIEVTGANAHDLEEVLKKFAFSVLDTAGEHEASARSESAAASPRGYNVTINNSQGIHVGDGGNHIHTWNASLADRSDSGSLFAKAVEQLGSDKATVRIGGLYVLERVAEQDASRAQRVADVICGYLRLPYARLEQIAERMPGQRQVDPWEGERQVRATAQRILSDHLKQPADSDQEDMTTGRFWPNIDIDLTNATLMDFNFDHCRVRSARFDHAEFDSDAHFIGVQFDGVASFNQVRFKGDALFIGARLEEDAHFGRAIFQEDARFDEAHFGYVELGAIFDEAHFEGNAWFGAASFDGDAYFRGARFGRELYFGNCGMLYIDEFEEARIRLNNGRTAFKSPTGWKVEEPASEEDGRLEGTEGRWGYLVRADSVEPA